VIIRDYAAHRWTVHSCIRLPAGYPLFTLTDIILSATKNFAGDLAIKTCQAGALTSITHAVIGRQSKNVGLQFGAMSATNVADIFMISAKCEQPMTCRTLTAALLERVT